MRQVPEASPLSATLRLPSLAAGFFVHYSGRRLPRLFLRTYEYRS